MLRRGVRTARDQELGEERTSEMAPCAPENVEKGEAGMRVSWKCGKSRGRTHLGTMGTMAKGKVRGAPLRHKQRVSIGSACSYARTAYTRHLIMELLW